MGNWDLVKFGDTLSTEWKLENEDLLYISYEKTVPSTLRATYFVVRLDENGHVQVDSVKNQVPDPSTIYCYLPINKETDAEPLSYSPHYVNMSPKQRFKYIYWLHNVKEPIDIGYVFLYYYGLERHLLVGNFDRAFDEIIKLRNVHSNKSFQKYSENALIHGAILRNRMDRLFDLHETTELSGFSNTLFLLANRAKSKLISSQLMLIFYKAFAASKKSIKEDKELFMRCIGEVLIEKNMCDGFSVGNYEIDESRVKPEVRFANYTFSRDIQFVQMVDFYQCKELMKDLEVVCTESVKLYKVKKKAKSTKLIENIPN